MERIEGGRRSSNAKPSFNIPSLRRRSPDRIGLRGEGRRKGGKEEKKKGEKGENPADIGDFRPAAISFLR